VSGVGLHGLVALSAGEGLMLRHTGDRMGRPMVGVGAVETGKVLSLQVIESVN
jgi:hypothetical protein